MHYKRIALVVTAFLPLMTMSGIGIITSAAASEADQPALNSTTNQEAQSLRLQVTCWNGEVVTLDNATLMEKRQKQEGDFPTLRLDMPDGGTVSIPWDDIEKITVGERAHLENTYPIEVTVKNDMQPKVGNTYGQDNTIFGLSEGGKFSIQLKEVQEIIVLPSTE
jgi:hypothetical protein